MLCLQTIFVCSGKRDILGIQRGWGFGTQVQLRTISLMVTNSMIKIHIPFLIKWLEGSRNIKPGFLHSRRESFGGHYVSQLACTFLQRSKNTKSTISTSKELM